MSEAPERIEIESECGHANTYNSEDRRTWLHFPDNAPDYFCAEYVRADRIEELEVKLAKAVEALEGLIELLSLSTNEINPKSVLEFAHATLAELKGKTDE